MGEEEEAIVELITVVHLHMFLVLTCTVVRTVNTRSEFVFEMRR